MLAAAVVAEVAFSLRDHGAFPHVNFYLPDPALGVRLRPGATERISFGGNPVTEVRINSAGYRGGDLPAPRPDEILVVGDSQAFGLGVEEQETFSARLASLTGRPVVNAGVPTYGPDEYDAVVAEMLTRRKPSVVVYTVNLANDLFEAERPNRERHAVWDGWAVRKETAPASSLAFPGRAWLFGRSHLMFSLRKVSHGRDAEAAVDLGLPSEGTWTDLVGAGEGAAQARVKARTELHQKVQQDFATRNETANRAESAEEKIAAAADLRTLGISPDSEVLPYGRSQDWLKAARSSVGDIVTIDLGEEGRNIPVTADLIEQAGDFRIELEQALRKKASAGGRRAAGALVSLADWQRSVDALRAMKVSPARVVRHASPLLPHIERLKKLCDGYGARLVVLVLPLDVTVSAGEWAKYGAAPREMGAARILADDLVRASEESGVSALDASPSLAAAEPGAFLKRDLHMSPKGHAAVAQALAAKIAEPPPEFPTGMLPADRTKLPGDGAWPDSSANSKDAENARCSISRTAEWWRVFCAAPYDDSAPKPREVTLLKGGRGDALTFATPRAMYLVAPVLPGDTLAADFAWSDSVQHFEIDPQGNARFTDAPAVAGGTDGPNALEAKILACFKPKASGDPSNWQFGADADCVRTYGDDCDRLKECSAGDPASPPDCPAGSVNAGALGRCHQLCGAGRPCGHGRCDAWPGAHLCE